MTDSAARWRMFALIAAAATILVGLAGIVAPRWAAGGQARIEGCALLAVLGAPSLFALFSFRARPRLLMVSAILSAVISPLLSALAPILWLLAAVYGRAFSLQPSRRSLAPAWAVAAFPVLLVVMGGLLILTVTGTTCSSIEGGVECRERTTSRASVGALVLVGVAVAGGLALSSPRPPASPAPT